MEIVGIKGRLRNVAERKLISKYGLTASEAAEVAAIHSEKDMEGNQRISGYSGEIAATIESVLAVRERIECSKCGVDGIFSATGFYCPKCNERIS